MNEKTRSFTKEVVRDVIKNKAWYGLDPITGAFDWPLSVQKIATQLSINPIDTGDAIKRSFTPKCLTQVEKPGKTILPKKEPLLKALKDKGIEPYIWTVGDVDWQKTKIKRSGTTKFVKEDHYFFSQIHKEDTLRRMIELLQDNNSYFIVVDDKRSNVDFIASLAEEYKKRGIEVGNYHMKLEDPNANATAFYKWLLEQMKNHVGKKLKLILDFDGVVANTDEVLLGPVVDNLFALLNS